MIRLTFGLVLCGSIPHRPTDYIDEEVKILNPMTNELRQFASDNNIPDDFIPLPDDLQAAARKKLAGDQSAFVSRSSGGRLSKWARQQRKKKNKMAKDSRRRNRA